MLGCFALMARPLAAAELRCPPMLPSAHPGFEQVGPVPTAHWQLLRMRLFDGPPGEELKTSPAELAPDSTSRERGAFNWTWRFAGDEGLLMVCIYNGSATYYRARPRPLPTACSLRKDNGVTQAWCDGP